VNREIYREMEAVESSHWWFRARRDIVTRYLHKQTQIDSSILDVGCGTGLMMDHLRSLGFKVEGFDYSDDAISICTHKGLMVKKARLPDVPSLEPVDTILMMDVLEHIENDRLALKNLQSAVKPGGHLLLTVPAHPRLWTVHDEVHHHFRRYTSKQLYDVIKSSGWVAEYLSPYNSHLFPIAVLERVMIRMTKRKHTNLQPPGALLNKLLYYAFSAESTRLSMNRCYPFGLSYFSWIRRPDIIS